MAALVRGSAAMQHYCAAFDPDRHDPCLRPSMAAEHDDFSGDMSQRSSWRWTREARCCANTFARLRREDAAIDPVWSVGNVHVHRQVGLGLGGGPRQTCSCSIELSKGGHTRRSCEARVVVYSELYGGAGTRWQLT